MIRLMRAERIDFMWNGAAPKHEERCCCAPDGAGDEPLILPRDGTAECSILYGVASRRALSPELSGEAFQRYAEKCAKPYTNPPQKSASVAGTFAASLARLGPCLCPIAVRPQPRRRLFPRRGVSSRRKGDDLRRLFRYPVPSATHCLDESFRVLGKLETE